MKIQTCTKTLVEGGALSGEDAYLCMTEIMTGQATPAQIAGYLVALRIRGEDASIIAASAKAMREAALPVKTQQSQLVDVVGTGGDASGTFNISTTVAFVVAGAGVTVAKHGNRSVSSKSGAADVLSSLGVNVSLSPEQMGQCLDRVGLAFLFAPALHPAMKHAIGPRKELGLRTLFNILGPLTNPAGAQRGLVGVYHRDLVPVVAEALAQNGAEHFYVVHGNDGLDEATVTGPTFVTEVKGSDASHSFVLEPTDLGLPLASSEALTGGTPEENANITRAILSGEEIGAKRSVVLLNAALALVTASKAKTIQEGVTLAADIIDSGKGMEKLNALIAQSHDG